MDTNGVFAWGFLVLMTSVVASGAVTEAKFSTSEPLAVPATSFVRIRLRVQAASSAVIGLPSDHFSPLRRVKVQVSLSADGVHLVARYGAGVPSVFREFREG